MAGLLREKLSAEYLLFSLSIYLKVKINGELGVDPWSKDRPPLGLEKSQNGDGGRFLPI